MMMMMMMIIPSALYKHINKEGHLNVYRVKKKIRKKQMVGTFQWQLARCFTLALLVSLAGKREAL